MMIERTSSQILPIPLSLAAGQRIVTPDGDQVLGWMGSESASVAQPLTFPASLLEPRATENIVYAGNLPAPRGIKPGSQPINKTLGADRAIPRKAEAAFLAASLPGGEASAVMRNGSSGAIRFRWACLGCEPNRSIWRFFWHLQGGPRNLWMAAGQDYLFDGGGFLAIAPQSLTLASGGSLTLRYAEGRLTSFPCNSGRVKITRMKVDGWRSRTLSGLFLRADRSVLARFSDGSETVIATTAPARTATAIAA